MARGGQKISTDIAKTVLKKGIECVPGWHKNYKNMLNLCHHEEDFKLQASWSSLQLAMGNLFAME